VVSEDVQPVQLDGEAGGDTPFHASIVPRAIRVLVPTRPRWRHGAREASD
jgi:diacylglycerol kinase family enzyme